MTANMKYPIGIQSFENIRTEGYTYIDKTACIHRLIDNGKYYFLSRPRRFGKSLLISTIEALYQGKRELFKGLAIDGLKWEWEKHEVLHIDFNGTKYNRQPDALERFLEDQLSMWEREYSVDFIASTIGMRFRLVIEKAHEVSGRNVVILIDEYDKPLLDVISDDERRDNNRYLLNAFFSVMKTMDKYIKFAMITGVSRFSKVSVFSGANNFPDISLLDDYADICGITEDELKEAFMPGIEELALKLKTNADGVLALLKQNYDGYHFSAECPDIYNPFSLLNALANKKISDYWFESGTPSFVIEVLKKDNFFLPSLDCIETLESSLGAKESYLHHPVSLLFETGYITIKSYDEEKESFRLGLPNEEVATSFSKALIPAYSGSPNTECDDALFKMRGAIIDGNAERFMELLKTFLQGNPYSNTELDKREKYFKNNIFLVLRALGFFPRVEEETCKSRMDVMLRTRRYVYIFELKTDGSANKAMTQIREKGYAQPYAEEGRQIIRIAANYSSGDNNITEWMVER